MTVSFGILGCGRIAGRHIQSLAAVPQAELNAVSDVTAERMDEAEALWRQQTNRFGQIKKYADYRELLDDPAIEAVVISSVSGMHAEMAKAALMSGKHIILEKPMTLSLQDANEIVGLASLKKRCVQVCHQLRYRPLLRKIKELLDEGVLGSVYTGSVTLRLNRSSDYYKAAPWRGTWESDGGMMLNQGIHLIDLLQWYLGDVRTVYCELVNGVTDKETEDAAVGVLSFAGGAKGVIEANSVTLPNNLQNSLCLIAEKGTINIGGPSFNELERWHLEKNIIDEEAARALFADSNEHIYMYENFIDAVGGKGKSALIDAAQGKRALEIIFAMYQSAKKAKPQSLPLAAFSTMMMR